MKSCRNIGFAFARAGRWETARVTVVTAIGLVALLLSGGCESAEPQAGTLTKEVGARKFAEVRTADLKARRTEVLKRYAEIQRDVELKSGLTMGVAIKDDRAQLGELYREAHEIERELMRRFSRGDPEVTMEQ